LHAFSADTGQEYFAFIPGGVFSNLYRLTQPAYTHRYFVDQSPGATDVFYGNNWHTVLTSGLGGGGQSVFALEVTRPDGYSESSTSPLLWEFTDAQDADLGYTFSRPTVVRLHNGKWAAVFGNGYNNTVTDSHKSSTGNAVLYIVDVETGALIKKLDTGVGAVQDPQSRPNGLSSPIAVDMNGDDITEYVYAGDLFGNLWKFNLTDSSPANWVVAYNRTPLFVAKNSAGIRQPITSRPSVGAGPNGNGNVVLFGTGKYLEATDAVLANLTTQSFYGIIDKDTGTTQDIVAGRSSLTTQEISYEGVHSFTDTDNTTHDINVRVVSNNVLASSSGWYLDLVSPLHGFEGEMQVTDSLISNNEVLFTTLIPNTDPCSAGGRSWLMALNLLTGSRLDTAPFDLNGDGKFDENDNIGSDTDSGVQVDEGGGTASGPTVVGDNDTGGGGCDYVFVSVSNGKTEARCANPGRRAVGRQSWRQAH
jgi:type IV pilus assembly protein PilY1